jgi:hypothetical protein
LQRRLGHGQSSCSRLFAKLLGFGYPGGPVIDKLAPYGNPDAMKFTLASTKGNTLDFSAIETAVLRWVEGHDIAEELAERRQWRRQPGLAGDNVAMIAAAAFPKLERGEFVGARFAGAGESCTGVTFGIDYRSILWRKVHVQNDTRSSASFRTGLRRVAFRGPG